MLPIIHLTYQQMQLFDDSLNITKINTYSTHDNGQNFQRKDKMANLEILEPIEMNLTCNIKLCDNAAVAQLPQDSLKPTIRAPELEILLTKPL